MDSNEAKELRMTVVLRGGDELSSLDARQTLTESITSVGRRIGASSVEVAFRTNEIFSGMRETDSDWVVE